MERSGCSSKGGNLGVSLQAKKFELSPSVGYHSQQQIESLYPMITDHIFEKKVSLIASRQILSNILPEAYIFTNTIMNYLKKLVGTQSLIKKQCPAGLSPKVILHYSPKDLWEILGMGKNPTQQPKMY